MIFDGILRSPELRGLRRRTATMRRLRAAAASLVLVLAFCIVSAALAADVTVFAAASLKEALDQQAKQFEASTGNKVVVSYAYDREIHLFGPAYLLLKYRGRSS